MRGGWRRAHLVSDAVSCGAGGVERGVRGAAWSEVNAGGAAWSVV